jgi:antitoxin HicB
MAIDHRTGRAVRLPLLLEPQPEGGYTVTSPLVPGFVTEGDDLNDVMNNVRDAWPTLVELYEETGRALPPELFIDCASAPVHIDVLIPA